MMQALTQSSGRPKFNKPVGTVIGQYRLIAYTSDYQVTPTVVQNKHYEYKSRYYIWECTKCGHQRKTVLSYIYALDVTSAALKEPKKLSGLLLVPTL